MSENEFVKEFDVWWVDFDDYVGFDFLFFDEIV